MKNATDYLSWIKALIVVSPQVMQWQTVREEAQGDVGLFRYRLRLSDGGLLEMLEYFRIVEGHVNVTKYSFHWQDDEGKLLRRWDNARHHSEVATHPHHVHVGADDVVRPHEPVDAERVLELIAEDSSA